MATYKAFRVEKISGEFSHSIQTLTMPVIKEDEVLIKVHYSALNYKDALSAFGHKGVTKHYPHTPGIDAVGIVAATESETFSVGQKVIVTSYDLGMNTDGGFAEYIKVPADWVVRLPEKMSMQDAMLIGTAGLTAGISVMKLTQSVRPHDGKIIVSGATGGVGSIAVYLLHKLGYEVVALTGKASQEAYLMQLGASEVLSRHDFEHLPDRALLQPSFVGAIDTVGGVILQNIIKSTTALGVVTCCGNVGSANLELTVFPFILRGVSLIGIDSQNYPMADRKVVWERFAQDWQLNKQLLSHAIISLTEVKEKLALLLNGQLVGRTIVKLID